MTDRNERRPGSASCTSTALSALPIRSDRCPPNQLMVFFGVRNKMVLLAFVKDKCVTFAEDILVQEFLRLTRGAADIASRITDVCFGANTGHAKGGLSIRCVKRPLIDQSRQGAHRASVHQCATIGLNAEGRVASSVNPLGPQKRTCQGRLIDQVRQTSAY